ncbi:hypothetical protein [Nonomuraea typhae]|nr:hypothetical protein [Nonomuraea typhae]
MKEQLVNPHEAELSEAELDEIHGGHPGMGAEGGSCTRDGGGMTPIETGG